MRFRLSVPVLLMMVLFGLLVQSPVSSEERTDWVKYCSWKGQVKDLIIMSILNEEIKVVFPVGSGFRMAESSFFAGDPDGMCVTKLEVTKSDGRVAIRKQYWQAPDKSLRVQIINDKEDWGNYEFTVYYSTQPIQPVEKMKHQKEVHQAIYDYDVYQMYLARAKDDFRDAMRWARSAYEIDRLNWDILNIIGELHYLLNDKDEAEDVFIILRDNGYLTPENMVRFEEISPYEASKVDESEEEAAEGEATEEEAAEEPAEQPEEEPAEEKPAE